ncbi:VOC family protein [Hyalangium rubrum]|uniref:VOC family protein n=1 Tax=Hyalangium rubrum TaxID=3103134 RepID=A0ABU5H9H6_9BACT|nr:VOC family protein [Hyalangium sp. s54d21]MDY7230136.1 VOC family protein [Hyalangium sp. s54d21]
MSEKRFTPGRVTWRELMTLDSQRAKAFYGELFGWTFVPFDLGPDGGNYEGIKLGEKLIGGIWEIRKGESPTSIFMSYVSVKDVDAAAKRAQENGGQVAHGPKDIPNMGRFAVLMDSDNAVIIAYQDLNGDPEPAMPKAGEFCWETLSTNDVERAKAFYSKVFGWQARSFQGGMSVFGVDDTPEGAVADIEKAQNMPPQWFTYVVVDRIETARDKAAKLGAQVLVPLVEVPNIGRIAMIVDPTGAPLGLFDHGGKA